MSFTRFAHNRRSLLATLAAGLLACACASSPTGGVRPTETREVHATVQRAWDEHIAAAQRDDLDAVMEIYAQDIVYAFEGAEDVCGYEAMRESESASLEGADVLEAEHRVLELRVFDGFAIEIGTVIGTLQPKGAEASEVTYTFMAWWQRGADGVWRIRRMAGRT